MTAAVLSGQAGRLRWIRLNRPESRNALNPDLIAAFDDAIAAAIDDPGTEAVVIAGNGPSFCAGADLRHLLDLARAGEDPIAFLSTVSESFSRLESAPKPVIAAVHGHVVAGGLELALVCDAVVARTGTLIGDGHIRNGLLPGAGSSVRLARKAGEPLARRLLLTGELLPAEHFLAGGFVHTVAADEEFDRVVTAVAESFTGMPPGCHARLKRLLGAPDAPDALRNELKVFAEHWHEQDIAAQLTRFFDHRATR
ncbi:enoyl-CoA hydratase/isomerase family protein [Spirillospora sp. NPDC052242]